jgi:hypothetical protein
MEKKPERPTTPEEEGIELHPDAWERFERNVQKVMKAPPVHRTGTPTASSISSASTLRRGSASPASRARWYRPKFPRAVHIGTSIDRHVATAQVVAD